MAGRAGPSSASFRQAGLGEPLRVVGRCPAQPGLLMDQALLLVQDPDGGLVAGSGARAARSYAAAAWRITRLPSAAAAACRVSPTVQAASAAAAGLPAVASCRICAVASLAVRAAWSQIAARSAGVSRAFRWPSADVVGAVPVPRRPSAAPGPGHLGTFQVLADLAPLKDHVQRYQELTRGVCHRATLIHRQGDEV
jgi:hypothetical protein